MNNEPNLEGAKPLLQLVANDEFAKLEVTDPILAYEYLYALMCGEMTKATVCIMMVVERMRMEQPEIYQRYIDHIHQSLIMAQSNSNQN